MTVSVEDELNQKVQHIRSLIARSRMSHCSNQSDLLEEARAVLSSVMSDVDVFGVALRDIGTNQREVTWFVSVIEQQPTKSMIPTFDDMLKGRF